MRYRAVEERFWEKVDRRGPDECWEWRASRSRLGYGEFKLPRCNSKIGAHRMAWQLANGPVPDGLDILHGCDNPACCNPAHLRAGTHRENMRDRDTRGRHGSAKLTAAEVVAIRAAVATGGTHRAIGKRFGINQSQVTRIVHGQRWAHVET